MNNCKKCNKETINPKFCSRSCSVSYSNTQTPRRKLTRVCSKCDDIIRNYRSTLCEKHYKEYKYSRKEGILNQTMKEIRDKRKADHRSSLHAIIRGYARTWFKELTKTPCANCNYNKHVELCHIKAISSFPDSTLIREVNHKDNIIQLCPNCHWEFDKSDLTMKIILSDH